MYSTHNEGKSAIAEKFIRIFRNKIYKYMILISKNMYINKLDNLVNEYKNTYHSTNKMKPADIKSSTYTDFDQKNKKEDVKFKVGDQVRIWKYKNTLLQIITCQIGLKKFLWLPRLNKFFIEYMLLAILTMKKLLKRFWKRG